MISDRNDNTKKINSVEKSWFALYTKPRSEFKAAQQISSLDVEYYLPTITKTKQWSDRKKKITEPVIRGYIFIYGDEKERLASLELHSVVRCIFEAGRPAKIPAWQMENLMRMLKTDSEFFVHEGILKGVKVKINEGPFKDIIGTVQEVETGKSIAVSIDLLNRSVIARLPVESSFEIVKE